MSEPVKLKLTKPVEAWGKMVDELSFKEPKGRDIVACGLPYTVEQRDGAALMHFDTKAVAAYVGRMANIDAPAVGDLCAVDFNAAALLIMGFFGAPSLATPGADSSGSPDSSRT